jgi:hypothetical protein
MLLIGDIVDSQVSIKTRTTPVFEQKRKYDQNGNAKQVVVEH